MTMTPEDYLDLPYRLELVHDRDADGHEGWVAAARELPGCISQGDTPDEAVARLREAMLARVTAQLEDGRPVPLPADDAERPSGKFVLRLPRGLHATAAAEAERESVSLNQLVVAVLAGALAWRAPLRRPDLPPISDAARASLATEAIRAAQET
jgi:antitoxin HicB